MLRKFNQLSVGLLTGLGLAAAIPLTGLAQSNSPSNFDSRYHNLEGGSAIGQRRITESVERINRGERFQAWWWNLITNWWVENPLLERSVDANWEQDRQALLRVFDLTGDSSCISQSTCIEEAERALSVYSNRLEEIEASQSPESSLRMAQNLILRGATYQVLGQTQQKEADWEQAIDVINQSQLAPINYVQLGNELYSLGYRQRAVELWETAQDSAGEDNLLPYLELGRFLHQFGQGSAARQYWNQIVNALPSNSSLRLALADQYVYFSRIGYKGHAFDNTALDKANEAIELEGENPYNWIGQAQILIGLEEFDYARNSLEQARQLCSETLCEEIITRIETYQLGLVAQTAPPDDPQAFSCVQNEGQWVTVINTPTGSYDLIRWVPNPESGPVVGNNRYVYSYQGDEARRQVRITPEPGFVIDLESRCRVVSRHLSSLASILLNEPDRLVYQRVEVPIINRQGERLFDDQGNPFTAPVICLEGFTCRHNSNVLTLTSSEENQHRQMLQTLQDRLRNPEQRGTVIEN